MSIIASTRVGWVTLALTLNGLIMKKLSLLYIFLPSTDDMGTVLLIKFQRKSSTFLVYMPSVKKRIQAKKLRECVLKRVWELNLRNSNVFIFARLL